MTASQRAVELVKYGEYVYDNLLLLTPEVDDFGSLQLSDLMDFVTHGGNVFVAASELLPEPSVLREFASECGVDFDAEGSIVTDHLAFEASAADHATVVASGYTSATPVVGASKAKGPVLFRGIGQAVDPENILAVKVLTGSPTAYSADPTKPVDGYPEAAGEQVQLVTSVQARNNARVTFVGSAWMLSNAAFEATVNGGATSNNAVRLFVFSCVVVWRLTCVFVLLRQYFAEQIVSWTFQEQGVIRATAIRHSRVDGSAPEKILNAKVRPNLPPSIYPDPEIAPESDVYRIKDDLRYQMDVQEFKDGRWQPFQASDMQLEFVMLDPYVRTTMKADADGTFTALFKAPDSYGIFKFRVMYRRAGLSVLHHETQVSVRPFRHNEYERFIEAAFPYYAGALSMMFGVFLFSVYFLYSK